VGEGGPQHIAEFAGVSARAEQPGGPGDPGKVRIDQSVA
jgi:hypothetical protein